ncbi:MAG: hypothetical protein ACE5IY_12175 [bacterium]
MSSGQLAWGQIPQTISYQGVLTDAEGNRVQDGNYQINFNLYETAAGGAGIWFERQLVSVSDGLFNVILGSVNPLNLLFDRPYWLGISIGSGQVQELTPRIQLTASPYSLNAQAIVDNAVTSSKIADGAVTLSKIDTTGASVGQVLSFTRAGVRWDTPPSGGGLTLPFSGTSFEESDAFSVQHEGANGGAGYFGITGINSSSALLGETFGTGSAGLFRIDSTPLVEVTGNFNASNACEAITNGTGRAAYFRIDQPINSSPALETQTNGTGPAGRFNINNETSTIGAVQAISSAFNGTGVTGIARNGPVAWGVYGETNDGIGVRGVSSEGIGVNGISTNSYGVFGSTAAGGGVEAGVYGFSSGIGGTGVIGEANSGTHPAPYGVWGKSTDGYAGFFSGDVQVTGNLTKASGAFKIDHPLDPQNKYLYHSFVESPDMMNIYNGNIILDAAGEARVELPEWFEALNRDFRYQLTAIGAPGPDLYIAQEIMGNRFRIAGGQPGMKVSWQVTGIRQDAFANAHRMPVEEEKPAYERGYYLHPELYGQREERSIEWARDPEGMRKMQERRQKLLQQGKGKRAQP